MFLPYLPGRHFSLKGFFAGSLIFLILMILKSPVNFVETLSWFFIITAISSFLAMNFTGSSTYTSLSGVKKEMKISVPFQIGFVFVGLVLQIVVKFIY
jgi:acetyl-CoA decarbonylase/synthase complex subunit gamma